MPLPPHNLLVEWITTIYQLFDELLHRAPEPAGLAAWMERFDTGTTGEQARDEILAGREYNDQNPPVKPMPPSQPRTPLVLPVCGSCPHPDSYDKVLPWTPPKSRDFLRADAWGVPVVGLPFVAGGSSEHPERLLTAFLYKYDRALWPACFQAHRDRGYTHWILWWPNARADGMPLAAFVEMCKTIQAAGFYTQVGLNSKECDPRDRTPAEWQSALDPVFNALNAAKAADEYAVWEWDSHNVPGQPTIDAFRYMGRRAHEAGASFWAHFIPEHTSWFADGDSRGRFGFWSDLGKDVDGLQYQAEPGWDIGEIQARLVDTLKQFAQQGDQHKVRAFELTALLQFTHDRPTEDEANALGYLACCTAGPTTVWGYGNGARRLNGSAL
jgi:hypothetical protein